MTLPPLEERTLSELSKLRVRFFIGASQRVDYLRIMVVHFSGTYPRGCEGNSDALFMCAMVEAGKAAFDPHGLIYDLSELSYEWGDALGDLFSIGPKYNFGDHPVAVVVGPHSEEAVRTLCLGLESKESIEAMGFVFRDLASAWAYVDSRIIKDTLVKELAKLKQRHGSGPTTEEAGSQEGQPRA